MAGFRPSARPVGMSGALATAAALVGAIALAPAGALADASGDGQARGWYDSSDPGGYHLHARRNSRPGETAPARPRLLAPARKPSPTHCAGAAEGLYVAAPLGFIAGKPVACGRGEGSDVTPQRLAADAWDRLRLPPPQVRTAPPRGTTGLVGLAEWLWVPGASWHPRSKLTAVAGVWARVTAVPQRLSFQPGDGSPDTVCTGPGVAFDPGRPVARQHTDCSHTFARASAGVAGEVYRVRVKVVWSGSWAGSGDTGGVLPPITRSVTFPLHVGEAQGLYG
jgi:hypothetical protein